MIYAPARSAAGQAVRTAPGGPHAAPECENPSGDRRCALQQRSRAYTEPIKAKHWACARSAHPRGVPSPYNVRITRARVAPAACNRERFSTFARPRRRVRRAPPVSQTGAKVRYPRSERHR